MIEYGYDRNKLSIERERTDRGYRFTIRCYEESAEAHVKQLIDDFEGKAGSTAVLALGFQDDIYEIEVRHDALTEFLVDAFLRGVLSRLEHV